MDLSSPDFGAAMASSRLDTANQDTRTVAGFGEEWTAFDQSDLAPDEQQALFNTYFAIFPWHELPPSAVGFDLGCGSGRWAALAAPRVGGLACVDASADALGVARRRLSSLANVTFHHASVDAMPLPDASQDFGYSLGVLHHVPDTAAGLAACVAKLKPGAPFLVYLYYRFDNRPAWFRGLWAASDVARRGISRLPFRARKVVTDTIAATVYWPLSRAARLGERLGRDVARWPLSAYRKTSFYTLRTDALDRFGTRLEQRFTRAEIESMMRAAGLERIVFHEGVPYWVALGYRRSP
jgi:SAM-dependent methyltransferase